MAFERDLWSGLFHRNAFPKFHCPTCIKGSLTLNASQLLVETPQYSIDVRKDENWEPDWTVERFSARLKCTVTTCGEIVTVIGDSTVAEDEDEEHGWILVSLLRVQAIFPAPPIIELPKEVPEIVADQIKKSFSLFWIEFGACANRLRTSVEFLLDHFKVPREFVDKNGKVSRMDLNSRIASFQKQDPDHAETLTALRMIGNLGAHGADVECEAILDAYEIYEDCLADLCGMRKARMAALRKKLISTKGSY